jgi:hypothetical protein
LYLSRGNYNGIIINQYLGAFGAFAPVLGVLIAAALFGGAGSTDLAALDDLAGLLLDEHVHAEAAVGAGVVVQDAPVVGIDGQRSLLWACS